MDRKVPDGSKWCPDCDTIKPLLEFPRTPASRTGRATYCLPCHNIRGKASKDKVGGSRTYHMKRRYGVTAEQADVMLAAQGGMCAICEVEPAVHVDHHHATGRVRQLLCFNCNGGLGQFKDDPAALRAAAGYVERHRAAQNRTVGEPVPRQRVSRGQRQRPRPGGLELRRRGAGCPTHDLVRARVAALVASLERPAAR
ncbi:endonuclease VII domain-containing protein [Geodermatophilus sp. SYSU D00710]